MNQPRQQEKRSGENRRQGERLVAVLIAGLVLMNYPLLSVFSAGPSVAVLGIPLLYFFLFGSWALVILAVALVLGPGQRADREQQASLGAQEQPQPPQRGEP